MHRVFNMGVGMVLVCAPMETPGILRTLSRAGEKPRVIGKVVKGNREVTIG
jgi:phosphoribosylformylglycinamidine cyclo-ligase